MVSASCQPRACGRSTKRGCQAAKQWRDDRVANADAKTDDFAKTFTRTPPTRAYFAKRKADGKSKKEIFRCLTRYVAREVYRTLVDRREEAARSAA